MKIKNYSNSFYGEEIINLSFYIKTDTQYIINVCCNKHPILKSSTTKEKLDGRRGQKDSCATLLIQDLVRLQQIFITISTRLSRGMLHRNTIDFSRTRYLIHDRRTKLYIPLGANYLLSMRLKLRLIQINLK